MVRARGGKKAKSNSTVADVNQYDDSLTTDLFSNVKNGQLKSRVKKVSWRDEHIQNMSVGEIDPAILCVREMIRYSKEQLLEIAKAPAAKSKPDFLDPNEVCVSILDPEKWNIERKKSDTPDTGKGNDSGDNRRRSGDPRERIRKENDGIVLSPQRRSFNSGCFVPANKEPVGGKGDAPTHLMGGREITSSTRRIGSGRIMRDSWENDKESGESDFNFGRGLQNRNNERDDKFGDRGGMRDEKYGERRSFGREIDNGTKEKEGRRNSRYTESRRRYSESKEDEPEWFSSGPMSQNDTIELRGFDESEKPGKRKMTASRVKRVKDWSKKKENTIAEDKEKDEEAQHEGSSVNHSETGEQKDNSGSEQGNEREVVPPVSERKTADQSKMPSNESMYSFDFDEFLKGEAIPGLLPNGASDDANKSTSRFSRWFKKDSPNKEVGTSRKSSLQEDNHIIKDLLKDITESSSIPVSVHPPAMDSNTYFAPISPAGNNFGGVDGSMGGDKKRPNFNLGQQVNIMDLLTRGKQGHHPEGWNGKSAAVSSIGSGKILSLDELEAKIRPNSDHSTNVQSKVPPQKPDEEMTAAFKRLLQQASGQVQNGPMNKPPGMSLLEMLNHSQQQDEARMVAQAAALAINQPQPQHLSNPLHAHQQPSMTNDLMMKLQQAQLQQKQMDMLGKLISASGVPAASHVRASPLLDMGVQQSRELLNRPEAQAILQGLKRGEITIQHLYQQIANPALQPRHREMLVTIVKLHSNSSYIPSPRVMSPVPMTSHHLFPPQQQAQMQHQQLRVSPLPHNAYCVSPIMATSPNHLAVPAMHQRIPSPRELQVHTQNILQRALIKKKLEEQTENFRKKQEMQRGASPNITGVPNSVNPVGAKGMSSPTPLAFTPTSVLRKMTAEKDEGKENKAVTDNGMKLHGRPLTGIRSQPQVTDNNQQWNPAFPMKQAGRPIVKANNYQSQTPDQFFAQLATQQQPLPPQRTYQNVSNPAHLKVTIGQQFSAQGSQYGPSQTQYSHPNPQPFPQPTAQQLRAQHQARPSNSATQQPTNQSQQETQNQSQVVQKQQQMAQQTGTAAWQPYLNTMPGQHNNRQAAQSRSAQHSGPLSPTTADQLTRWFSPDLLERARGGELPSTANLARLEEIERQAAPPVHN
ncbi:eukaryotic translation initiation factor 4E transporter-like isoform X2 [Euwallacea similis]|uniref:eukaryotic translation initiation factor 4E transporter-like isoform X2 n=1 Tax=Euwallacea similis TaxID=1736056 RepID=UPI00344ECAEB